MTLHFKPSGTLLRLQIQNNTGQQQTFSRVVLSTNAFFTDWQYDLANIRGGNLAAGKTASLETWSKAYDIAPVTLEDGQSSSTYLYLWVMPRAKTEDPLATKPMTKVILRNTTTNKSYLGAQRTVEMSEGGLRLLLPTRERASNVLSCYPNGGVLPAQYLAWGIVNPGGNALVPITDTDTNYNTTKWGYFSWVDAQKISIAGYHLPTIQEWRGIFPTAAYYYTANGKKTTDVSETFTVGSQTLTLTADYKTVNGVIYAIRGKRGDNCNRIAYRYQVTGSVGQSYPTTRFVVTMKYVGDRDDVDIESISSTSTTFWDIYDDKLSFPFTGQYYPDSFTYHLVQLWASTVPSASSGNGDNAFSSAEFVDASLPDSKDYRMPVMLFKDKL